MGEKYILVLFFEDFQGFRAFKVVYQSFFYYWREKVAYFSGNFVAVALNNSVAYKKCVLSGT